MPNSGFPSGSGSASRPRDSATGSIRCTHGWTPIVVLMGGPRSQQPYGRRSAHTAGPASAPSRTDYTITKGKVSLAVYRKRVDAPAPARSPRPVLFLVHGSSNSALSSFDLTVPVPANL
jgi:hypothetical protein